LIEFHFNASRRFERENNPPQVSLSQPVNAGMSRPSGRWTRRHRCAIQSGPPI